MARNLCDEDCRAVDFLLSRDGVAKSPADPPVSSARVSPERIEAAAQILGILQTMPAAEPPDNLVAQTVQRVEQSAGRMPPPIPEDPQRPQA